MLELRTEVWKRLTFSKEGGAVPGSRFSPGPEAALCWEEGALMAGAESPGALGHSEESSLSEMSPGLNHCLASPGSERIEDSEGIVLPICPPAATYFEGAGLRQSSPRKRTVWSILPPAAGRGCPLPSVWSTFPVPHAPRAGAKKRRFDLAESSCWRLPCFVSRWTLDL